MIFSRHHSAFAFGHVPCSGEREVGASAQTRKRIVHSEAEAGAMEHRPYCKLGRGVALTLTLHSVRAARLPKKPEDGSGAPGHWAIVSPGRSLLKCCRRRGRTRS